MIDGFSARTSMLRVGAEAEHDFDNGVTASAGLAYVFRTTDAGSIAYVLLDIMSGDLAGQTGSSEWVEASVGLVVPVGEMATTAIHATGRLPSEGNRNRSGLGKPILLGTASPASLQPTGRWPVVEGTRGLPAGSNDPTETGFPGV